MVKIRAWVRALRLFSLPACLRRWCCAAGKAPLKYRALGEAAVFLVMGPLMFAGLPLALAGAISPLVVALSFPAGLHIIMILTANNLRDADGDRRAGIGTIVTAAGPAAAKVLLCFEILLLEGLIVLSAALGWMPWTGLAAFTTLPLEVRQAAGSVPPALGRGDRLGLSA
ncbi:MAG: prenyltransferase [Spirochaetales bacterium]|nr:prenyltransferase [Spirochaetales bacterium]